MGESIIDGSWVLPVVLSVLGLLVGAYGTLIGVGGALLLVPAMIFLYPEADPLVITAVSLSIVLINALGAVVAYARQRRIDYRNGIIFAAATIPGVILGVWTLQFISRPAFSLILGLVMITIAAFLLFRQEPANARTITSNGYDCNRPLGSGLSLGAGYLAGLLGIGGGIIHVPVLVYILHFPAHVATATSSFILLFTATAGVLLHLAQGNYGANWDIILWLAAGVVVGSQLGALLSQRLHGSALIKLLALALVVTGIRLTIG
ncbi:MAG: sulfite exporter TauE/SafE family protein [Dehalococcoidia bacterium]|nr:MAG: sulfite exporter TauE/SafE family protein [Dehalococcoidia bacterium]